jgi:hypothetical protein
VTLFALGALPATSNAAIIYDNINNSDNGFKGVVSNDWAAQRFNSDVTNLKLTDATLRLAGSTAGNFTLSLYSDAASLPGSSLGTLFNGTTSAAGVLIGGDSSVHFGGLSQTMSPNTNYWLVISVAPGDPTSLSWGITLDSKGSGSGFQTAAATSTNQGSTWSFYGAPLRTQIVAVPVPEPATLLLAVLSLVALGRLPWRSQRAAVSRD